MKKEVKNEIKKVYTTKEGKNYILTVIDGECTVDELQEMVLDVKNYTPIILKVGDKPKFIDVSAYAIVQWLDGDRTYEKLVVVDEEEKVYQLNGSYVQPKALEILKANPTATLMIFNNQSKSNPNRTFYTCAEYVRK